MYFILLDLEATCWQGNLMGREQEIIELGAVRLNGYGESLDNFQSLVRPVRHPRLSSYCTDLTGITQDKLNIAKPFGPVFTQFEDWFYAEDETHVLCTWGSKDMELITAESQRHDVDHGFLPTCIDLRAQYASMHRLPKEVGLIKALGHYDIEFEGSHHRALDDALNTARLFVHLLDRWQY